MRVLKHTIYFVFHIYDHNFRICDMIIFLCIQTKHYGSQEVVRLCTNLWIYSATTSHSTVHAPFEHESGACLWGIEELKWTPGNGVGQTTHMHIWKAFSQNLENSCPVVHLSTSTNYDV